MTLLSGKLLLDSPNSQFSSLFLQPFFTWIHWRIQSNFALFYKHTHFLPPSIKSRVQPFTSPPLLIRFSTTLRFPNFLTMKNRRGGEEEKRSPIILASHSRSRVATKHTFHQISCGSKIIVKKLSLFRNCEKNRVAIQLFLDEKVCNVNPMWQLCFTCYIPPSSPCQGKGDINFFFLSLLLWQSERSDSYRELAKWKKISLRPKDKKRETKSCKKPTPLCFLLFHLNGRGFFLNKRRKSLENVAKSAVESRTAAAVFP